MNLLRSVLSVGSMSYLSSIASIAPGRCTEMALVQAVCMYGRGWTIISIFFI